MRRQTAFGRVAPAGSSRDERLDPFSLPVRFAVSEAADGCVRLVELSGERVVLYRTARNIKMVLEVPIANYLGVAVRLEPPATDRDGAVAVTLEHRDPGLSLALYRANDGSDIVAEWQSWGRALKLPLLVAEPDGRLREPFPRVGAVRVGPPRRRRRRRTAISRRRPMRPLRRRMGRSLADAMVHRGEREIIARN